MCNSDFPFFLSRSRIHSGTKSRRISCINTRARGWEGVLAYQGIRTSVENRSNATRRTKIYPMKLDIEPFLASSAALPTRSSVSRVRPTFFDRRLASLNPIRSIDQTKPWPTPFTPLSSSLSLSSPSKRIPCRYSQTRTSHLIPWWWTRSKDLQAELSNSFGSCIR